MKLVKLFCKVTPMTFWNLNRLAGKRRYGDNIGRVIDDLVRNQMSAEKRRETLQKSKRLKCRFFLPKLNKCCYHDMVLNDDSLCDICGISKDEIQ